MQATHPRPGPPASAPASSSAPAPHPARGLPEPSCEENRNPPGVGLWALLAEDYRTNGSRFFQPGFLAIAVHRLVNARWSIRSRLLRFPVSALCRMLFTWVSWTFGIEIQYYTQVGRRLHIYHHGATMLGARAIGDDCHIRHNTTLGVLGLNDPGAIPVIGNRVELGVGTVVAGAVHVGDDAVIAANSLVLRDVPPHAVFMGVPARQANFLVPPEQGSPTERKGSP